MSPVHAPDFQALIVPHRSLTPVGVVTVIGVLTVPIMAIAVRFGLLGAWPVAACSLLEIPLVIVLLALNSRQARASELIILNADDFTVVRTDPVGRRKQVSLPAAWLRVDLDVERGVPHVVLRSHGRRCEVGGFLHEPAKVSLFDALCDALFHSRNPRFENPQLYDR